MKTSSKLVRLLAATGTIVALAAPASSLASSNTSMHHMKPCTNHQVMSHHTSHCMVHHTMKHTK
jgi:hypothetical protein